MHTYEQPPKKQIMYIKQNKLEHQRIDKKENQNNNKTYTITAMAEEGLLISGRQAGRQADKQTNRCA